MTEGIQLKLLFGPHLVGTLSDVYYSEFNWYGRMRPADGIPPRIREFIALCRDWHARLQAGQPHDPAEFDAWRDVHSPGEWWTMESDGLAKRIAAPVFWPNTEEICWRDANGG